MGLESSIPILSIFYGAIKMLALHVLTMRELTAKYLFNKSIRGWCVSRNTNAKKNDIGSFQLKPLTGKGKIRLALNFKSINITTRALAGIIINGLAVSN